MPKLKQIDAWGVVAANSTNGSVRLGLLWQGIAEEAPQRDVQICCLHTALPADQCLGYKLHLTAPEARRATCCHMSACPSSMTCDM